MFALKEMYLMVEVKESYASPSSCLDFMQLLILIILQLEDANGELYYLWFVF